jgi:hypothetical protein
MLDEVCCYMFGRKEVRRKLTSPSAIFSSLLLIETSPITQMSENGIWASGGDWPKDVNGDGLW